LTYCRTYCTLHITHYCVFLLDFFQIYALNSLQKTLRHLKGVISCVWQKSCRLVCLFVYYTIGNFYWRFILFFIFFILFFIFFWTFILFFHAFVKFKTVHCFAVRTVHFLDAAFLSERKKFHDIEHIHCKKRLTIFLSPAGMSLTKLSLDGNSWIIPVQRERSKTSWLGMVKWQTFFTVYGILYSGFSKHFCSLCYTIRIMFVIIEYMQVK
jgi:hypothetical protein